MIYSTFIRPVEVTVNSSTFWFTLGSVDLVREDDGSAVMAPFNCRVALTGRATMAAMTSGSRPLERGWGRVGHQQFSTTNGKRRWVAGARVNAIRSQSTAAAAIRSGTNEVKVIRELLRVHILRHDARGCEMCRVIASVTSVKTTPTPSRFGRWTVQLQDRIRPLAVQRTREGLHTGSRRWNVLQPSIAR